MAKDRADAPDAKPLRLFVAVEIPESAKDVATEAVAPWRERFPAARWVPRENWHLTLKFLGPTRPGLADWVRERVTAVAREHDSFDTRMLGLDAFPTARRARVVWVGMDDRKGEIARLAGALDAALAHEFALESRPFRPHVTVARSDPPLTLSEEFGDTPLESATFSIDAVALFRSHLQRPAPRYERLETFPLAR